MDAWLQQQVEALLVAYNASQQAARRKARTVTPSSPKKIEITPGVARLRNVKRWHIADEERDSRQFP